MPQTVKFGILKNRNTKLIKFKSSWDKCRQTKGYNKMLWYFLLMCGLQRAVIFSEDSLPYLWKWNVHVTSQISLMFLKVPNLAVCSIFLKKYSSIWPNFFSKCLLYLDLWNKWLWLSWKPRKYCFCGFHDNNY